jgi:hypothetical protein
MKIKSVFQEDFMRRYFAALMAALVVGLLSGCDAKDSDGVSLKKYVPEDVEFVYGSDGVTWSSAVKQIPVGETFYLKVTVAVKGKTALVPFHIKVPNTEVTDVTYQDGTGAISQADIIKAIDGSSNYNFTVIAGKSASVVFHGYPVKAGNQQFVVWYDKPVSSAYSNTRTLVYIEE